MGSPGAGDSSSPITPPLWTGVDDFEKGRGAWINGRRGPRTLGVACGGVIGPPQPSSELPLHTSRKQVLRKWDVRAIPRKLHALVALPGLLGRRHEAHRRASDPYVETPDAPGRIRGGPKTSQIAYGSVLGPPKSLSELPLHTSRKQVLRKWDVRAIPSKLQALVALPKAFWDVDIRLTSALLTPMWTPRKLQGSSRRTPPAPGEVLLPPIGNIARRSRRGLCRQNTDSNTLPRWRARHEKVGQKD